MDKKKIIGIAIFVVLILIVVAIKMWPKGDPGDNPDEPKVDLSKLKTVYVATGGGKADFLKDPEVVKILQDKYKLNAVWDDWSNGKTVLWPLIREQVKFGDQTIVNNIASGQTYTITSPGVTKYDALFTSDQRYYDYYKQQPDKEKGEADRYYVKDGGLTLNTPIVVYSWKSLIEPLVKEGIVTEKDGVYYITNMKKIIEYDLAGKKWSDIGVTEINKNKTIHITSTDPVVSSPGETYYGLLTSVLIDGVVNEEKLTKILPTLDKVYKASGYMMTTPADLFDAFLKQGVGGYQMIVDYEKSMVEFINKNPDGYEQIKDKVVILYPAPTIWNSHCFTVFTDNGAELYAAIQDPEIQKIAWSKYGFRTGVTGGTIDTSFINGVPQEITDLASGLKMNIYNKTKEYLKEHNN